MSHPPLAENKMKNDGADILRGVAILMVVVFHALSAAYGKLFPWVGSFRDFQSPSSQQQLWFYPLSFGWAGVPLFFVLSGFCIHLSFLHRGKLDIPLFFWRRFWRIYPAYFISLSIFTFLTHLNIFSHDGAQQFLAHVLLVQNFHDSTIFAINGPLWSIAVEVQLYLLFPLLIFLRSHFGIIRCLQISLAIGLLFMAVAVARWGIPYHDINPALTSPFVTWFDWILGALVAERFFDSKPTFRNKKIWLALLMPLFLLSSLFKPLSIFSFSIASIIAAISLDAAIYVRWKQSVWVKSLIFIATISYSIYLWHQPLLVSITQRLSHSIGAPAIAWLLFIPLIVVGSWISFRYIEQIGVRIGSLLWKQMVRSPKN
jgi:peptidoglycan/LPS O-acetylase OafA/YrhL